MFAFLKRRAFLIVLGFLLVAVFIWYAGPYFAFADYAPLASVVARLIAIALVVALWLGAAVLKRLRSSQISDRLVAAVASHRAEAEPSAEAAKLRERFEEAVAALKQHQRTGRSLYDLPWYVIIGAPGSGKTTALLNSGLKFPLESRVGKGALRGVGGTRNCDWWFTDEAVFLDTAGRYTTQDSDASSDSAAWKEFLGLLRKYRKRRPLNGVILTLNAHDLMVLGDSGREAHVEAVRRRLRELNTELQIQLPVYLMVTKCDLVAGFMEYFDDLTQDARAQVWGVTFPYDQKAGDAPAQAFPGEFDALMARLNARLFARIEEERDVHRRTALFAFPQQMAALRDHLAQFIAEVLPSGPRDQPILLRGVYLTSGTQEGTPIDRLLGSLGRRFGFASDTLAPATGRGKAYFVERFLREVMIGESGLAGVNRRVEMQKAALQLGAYAAMAIVAVVGLVVLVVSFRRNQTYLEEVGAAVTRARAVPIVRAGTPPEAFLPNLDATRAVVDVADRYREDTPWAMRWGLYQGSSIGKSARDAYLWRLDGFVSPVFADRIKQQLTRHASEPDKVFEHLKAYLMLGEPAHFDRKYLEQMADAEWSPTNGTSVEAALAKHVHSLLGYADRLRPIALDPVLVAQARNTVRQASIARIVYGEIQRSYADDVARAVRLDAAAGLGADRVFRRRSGKSLSEPIPSIYGRAVFKEVTGTQMPLLIKRFTADNWVWGEGGVSANPLQLASDVADVYERDYIIAWDAILDDLQLVPLPSVAQMTEALGSIAAPTSPLRALLTTVVDQTTLVDVGDKAPTGALATAKSAITDGVGKVLQSVKEVAGVSTRTPGALVTAHFQPIHRLFVGDAGSAPIDKILGQFAQIQQQLKTLGPNVGRTDPLAALSNPALHTTLDTLQQEAAALPPLVGAVIAQIGQRAEGSVMSTAAGNLRDRYDEMVKRECDASLGGRYPFAAGSSADVTLQDFARMFGAGGVFDRFFEANMRTLVDTSDRPWKWRPGSGELPHSLLSQFEQAQLIRDIFFPQGGQAPQISFTITITRQDRSNRRFVVEIDGQNADDEHGSQRKWPTKWPASDPGYAAATFVDGSGSWPTVRYQGPWAWFRLIDGGQVVRLPPLQAVLSFQQAGYASQVGIDAASIRNPFAHQEWRQFRCGS